MVFRHFSKEIDTVLYECDYYPDEEDDDELVKQVHHHHERPQ